jgi:hypothetical protein
MITPSPLLGVEIKMIGLTAVAAILVSPNVAIANAQQEGSDGGLRATLNAPNYMKMADL